MVDWGTVEFYRLNLASKMTFKAKLQASEDATGSLLCLGLDPEPDLLPASIERSPRGIAEFVQTVVEVVGDAVSSYKLNLAFYERWGREGSWVFIVCRTSNPGASEFQHLRSDGEALYRHIARAAVRWDHHDNVALVVGATAPAELRDVRQIAGDRLLLVPGLGAQGGDLTAAVRAALRADGRGAIFPVSRGILFASAGADYAEAAGAAARQYREAINALRPEPATARG